MKTMSPERALAEAIASANGVSGEFVEGEKAGGREVPYAEPMSGGRQVYQSSVQFTTYMGQAERALKWLRRRGFDVSQTTPKVGQLFPSEARGVPSRLRRHEGRPSLPHPYGRRNGQVTAAKPRKQKFVVEVVFEPPINVNSPWTKKEVRETIQQALQRAVPGTRVRKVL